MMTEKAFVVVGGKDSLLLLQHFLGGLCEGPVFVSAESALVDIQREGRMVTVVIDCTEHRIMKFIPDNQYKLRNIKKMKQVRFLVFHQEKNQYFNFNKFFKSFLKANGPVLAFYSQKLSPELLTSKKEIITQFIANTVPDNIQAQLKQQFEHILDAKQTILQGTEHTDEEKPEEGFYDSKVTISPEPEIQARKEENVRMLQQYKQREQNSQKQRRQMEHKIANLQQNYQQLFNRLESMTLSFQSKYIQQQNYNQRLQLQNEVIHEKLTSLQQHNSKLQQDNIILHGKLRALQQRIKGEETSAGGSGGGLETVKFVGDIHERMCRLQKGISEQQQQVKLQIASLSEQLIATSKQRKANQQQQQQQHNEHEHEQEQQTDCKHSALEQLASYYQLSAKTSSCCII